MFNKVVGEYAELCFLQKAARLGLVVSKPYGESMPYDMVVDHGTRLNRIQVKSTAHKSTSHAQYDCYRIITCRDVRRRSRVYNASEIDFVAAYIVPQDAWYLIPVGALNGQETIMVFPNTTSTRSKWEKYREAWHLLLPEPSARRIFAQADTGNHLSGVIDELGGGELRDESRPEAGYSVPYIAVSNSV